MDSPSEGSSGVDWTAPIPATWAWLVGIVAIHGGTGLHQWARGSAGAWEAFLGERGARFRALVGGQHASVLAEEPWRLWTSVLLHADALHLALNGLALVALGRLLEPWIGGLRFTSWILAGGVAGSAASYFAGVTRSDGLSGGLYALVGVLVVLYWRRRPTLPPEDRRLLGPVLHLFLAVNVLLSLAIPFIDTAGHLGGLAIGLVLGAVAGLDGPTGVGRWLNRLWVTTCLVVVLLGALQVAG